VTKIRKNAGINLQFFPDFILAHSDEKAMTSHDMTVTKKSPAEAEPF